MYISESALNQTLLEALLSIFVIGCQYKGFVISEAFLPLKAHLNEMRQRNRKNRKQHKEIDLFST